MAKQSLHAGRPVGDNKISESSYGSYLATNLEQEVAALNRARAANSAIASTATTKINGVMIGAAAVFVASVAGIIGLATWAYHARNPAPPTSAVERPSSISIPPTIQRPNRAGATTTNQTKRRVRGIRPPTVTRSIFPRRTSSTLD